MKIELNTEKNSLLFVGPYSFTFGETSYEVDLDSLSPDLKKQFLYNLRMGFLLAETGAIEQLIGSVEEQPSMEVPIAPQQPVQAVLSDTERIEEDLKELRKILEGNIISVKAAIVGFRVARLRKLLELEEAGKKRKGLISFLKDTLDKHNKSVLEAVGDSDIAGSHQEDPKAASTQVTDIVESDEGKITFSLDDVKESEDGELVITQEVLNQLGD